VRTDVADRASVEAMALARSRRSGESTSGQQRRDFATVPMSRSPFDEIEIENGTA